VPRRVAIVSNDDDDEENADDSGEEYVTATKHDFKHQTRQPKGHFKKLLEATFLKHS
jgi:hypothetical protein